MPDKIVAPLLLCASPRPGNSLEAARLFARGFNQSADSSAAMVENSLDALRLADYRINPCIDCGACSKGKPCPFLKLDDSAELFEAFLHAPLIAISAPIYFYHIPAQLKALLDRCQQYYAWRGLGLGGLDVLPRREAYIILTAAREKGEQLFTGSLLTLKLALAPFNISLKTPLELRGLDAPDDLHKRQDYQEALLAYGAEAAASLSLNRPKPYA